jgi:ATP-dependent RNA helicase DeaD
MDHIRRKTVSLDQVSCVVLDEADRMLDMGFRDDIDTVLRNIPENRQTVLFSATLSKDIKQIAKEYQKDAAIVNIKQDTLTVDTVKQYYVKIPRGQKILATEAFLKEKKFNKCLIFVGTKSMADTLTEELLKNKFAAAVIHGNLYQRKRDAVMNKYRAGTVNILVATDVVARGIDVDNIDAVINFDIPDDSDCYVHRIGRTGRANQSGTAYTFIYAKEQPKLESIIKDTGASIEPTLISGINSESAFSKSGQNRARDQKQNHARSTPYGKKHRRTSSGTRQSRTR